ncbi:MAG: tRNA (N(6)-L-threonylcarbamoyladenosine(37)-C(2))-methylthiotransferase MtaB [Desulfobulbus propionicus]|nr:MAG: tRNA (N(6)-L-threonylcarbamoyladenosine(37)-C(2))-methylthiotransferase MtaB [Desulfobulbus propionicus]
MRVAVATLGCKVNQFESASFMSSFEQAGCFLVSFSAKADLYVINTCAVTAKAAQQSRRLIRRAQQTNPHARVVVTGCYVQTDPGTILDILETPACLIGNEYKHLLVDTALQHKTPDLVQLMGTIGQATKICDLPVETFGDRTRAYLRIQDGCDNFCTYCTVPYTRGPGRSLGLAKIMHQTHLFSEQGYKEIVITGINVGTYGRDLNEGETIYTILHRLCDDFPLLRIRLSSIDPTEVNDTLIDLVARHQNFMPHLHIPLQSGDDTILKRMNRRYDTTFFRQVIQKIHTALPQAAIGCDILGGFPGETEQHAKNTYHFLADLPVSYLHVFPYSKRHGTLAAALPEQVAGPVKTARVTRLRKLDLQLRTAFYQRLLGSHTNVLVERHNPKTGLLQGFSENYIPLHFPGHKNLVHQIVPVHFTRLENGKPRGKVAYDRLEENQ